MGERFLSVALVAVAHVKKNERNQAGLGRGLTTA
jgi:hypothetical protein